MERLTDTHTHTHTRRTPKRPYLARVFYTGLYVFVCVFQRDGQSTQHNTSSSKNISRHPRRSVDGRRSRRRQFLLFVLCPACVHFNVDGGGRCAELPKQPDQPVAASVVRAACPLVSGAIEFTRSNERVVDAKNKRIKRYT